jgi:hypothetical protein
VPPPLEAPPLAATLLAADPRGVPPPYILYPPLSNRGIQFLSSHNKYLGLPLSLRKLSSDSIQPIIDSIADQLPGWKADLTTLAGRRVHVQFVLTSKLVYLALAVDFPQWAHKAVNKIRRGYLWRGHTNAKGGHCLVAWDSVCRPLELGGLGISNLTTLGWALKVRWLWLQKTQPQWPWSSLPIQIPEQDRAFFSVAMASEVGNGAHFFLD